MLEKIENREQVSEGQTKYKELRVTIAQWTAVMQHAEKSGLGKLTKAGTQKAAFEFVVNVPVSVEDPG